MVSCSSVTINVLYKKSWEAAHASGTLPRNSKRSARRFFSASSRRLRTIANYNTHTIVKLIFYKYYS